MNRIMAAAVGAAAALTPVVFTRQRSAMDLRAQVLQAYRRGWHDGQLTRQDAECTGTPSGPPDARRVVGDDLYQRWAGLGLGYLAHQLRQVDRATWDLRYTPSWSRDAALAGDETGPPASLREALARQRVTVRRQPHRYLSVKVGDQPTRVYPLAGPGQIAEDGVLTDDEDQDL